MGLESALSYKQNALSMGFWIEIDDDWISVERYHTIMGPYTSGSVTMNPGEAYKIYATNAVVTLDASNIPSNKWGMEGHAEIFVANTGYIHTTSRVVLANALEPDAVNNITARFHDGLCILSVEDHVAGYIVTVNAGTTAGSLYYGLATSTNEYIAVDASLNGSTLDLGGAVTNGEKHVVGNGYSETIVSGGINCTSKTTLSNLAANGVVVSSGTLTLGDVYIPNGATVAVSGGGLAVEKVTGDGNVNLGGTNVKLQNGARVEGCTFSGGSAATNGGGFFVEWTSANITSCTITGNTAAGVGGGVACGGATVTLTDTVCSGNNAVYGKDMYIYANGVASALGGCELDKVYVDFGTLALAGSNTIGEVLPRASNKVGTVIISSGAVIDLTGNSNATPINPGGGVTFAPGGATVYPSAGSASAYMLGGMTVPTIGNTNVVNLGGTNVVISSGGTAYASGCVFSGGSTTIGGGAILINARGYGYFDGCTFFGNTAPKGGGIDVYKGSAIIKNSLISGNTAPNGKDLNVEIYSGDSASVVLSGCTVGSAAVGGVNPTYGGIAEIVFAGSNAIESLIALAGSGTVIISSGASINLTSSINPGGTGGIQVEGGTCTVNGNVIESGTYTSIDSTGTPT